MNKKKILSERSIDKYLSEFDITAAGVNAATNAVAIAQNLGKDAVAVADWAKKKIAERNKAKEEENQKKQIIQKKQQVGQK